MTHYLNNCANRDHKALFGADAFYDLNTDGYQAEMHVQLRLGESCVVASQPQSGVVLFSWYTFFGYRLTKDEKGIPVRVLDGTFVKEESMAKDRAGRHDSYRIFFDKNGNFKRRSVLRH